MMHNSRLAQFVFTAIFATCMFGGSLAVAEPQGASGKQSPAGQMCRRGSYVIGFDAEANIICSAANENEIQNTVESRAGGESETGESVDKEHTEDERIAETGPADSGISPSQPGPEISDVEPSSVVFGTAEVTITVSGTGFDAESIIIFAGKTYSASVNGAGTQLKATIPTSNLSIGPYTITVFTGTGIKMILKRALEIY